MKTLTKIIVCSILSLTTFQSCDSSETKAVSNETATNSTETAAPSDQHFKMEDLVDLDLSSYGLSVVVKAPKNSKVLIYDVNKSVNIYGGKFFKMTFSKNTESAVATIESYKPMVTSVEMNPDFDKLEIDEAQGYLKKDKSGKTSFTYAVDLKEGSVTIGEGMPFDISPDQFTDYTNEDIKLIWDAAKTAKAI